MNGGFKMIKDTFEVIYRNYKLHFYKEIFKKLNHHEVTLTALDFFCLETIYLLKEPTMSEFADFLEISLPNATYKIKNLIKKGYVKKEISEVDKRICHLKLTDKFKHFYEDSDYSGMFFIERIKKVFSNEELDHLYMMLKLIVEKINLREE